MYFSFPFLTTGLIIGACMAIFVVVTVIAVAISAVVYIKKYTSKLVENKTEDCGEVITDAPNVHAYEIPPAYQLYGGNDSTAYVNDAEPRGRVENDYLTLTNTDTYGNVISNASSAPYYDLTNSQLYFENDDVN